MHAAATLHRSTARRDGRVCGCSSLVHWSCCCWQIVTWAVLIFQVTAECFVHALPKVRVAKKTIERTTIPCTRRARHDTHTMATGSLGEGVPVVRRRLSYYIKYSVFRFMRLVLLGRWDKTRPGKRHDLLPPRTQAAFASLAISVIRRTWRTGTGT